MEGMVSTHKRQNQPIEIESGIWIVVTDDARSEDCAERLRGACLHALDRGAEHLAVDVTTARAFSADLADVFAALTDVVRARGGSLTLWARGDEHREPFVLSVGDSIDESLSTASADRGGAR